MTTSASDNAMTVNFPQFSRFLADLIDVEDYVNQVGVNKCVGYVHLTYVELASRLDALKMAEEQIEEGRFDLPEFVAEASLSGIRDQISEVEGHLSKLWENCHKAMLSFGYMHFVDRRAIEYKDAYKMDESTKSFLDGNFGSQLRKDTQEWISAGRPIEDWVFWDGE